MELVLSELEKLMVDSARKLCSSGAGPKRARAVRDRGGTLDRNAWTAIVNSGWLGMLVPEELDGLGLGERELLLVLEQAGRQVMPEPILSAVVAASMLGGADTRAARALLAKVLARGYLCVPALPPSVGWREMSPVPLTVQQGQGRFDVSGTLPFVPDCADAQGFLIAAGAGEGMVLFHAERGRAGVAFTLAPTVDGGSLGRLEFHRAPFADSDLVASGAAAVELLGRAIDVARLGAAAELLGIMEEALAMTIAYLKVREQFGRTLASFQALQHRAASLYVDVEVCRSLIFEACRAGGTRMAAAAAAAAKVRASEAALRVTKDCIQLHGAIGFADEHDIGLYLRRAMVLAARYGDPRALRSDYARGARLLEQ